MIKNPSKTWSIITILILLILVYFNTCTVYSFKNLASKRALPSKYKNYKVLDSLINDSTFEIKKFPFEPRYYDSIQNTIICTKGDSLYYKLNAKGLIIDSISVKETINYELHYLLHPNFYYDWIVTGDKTKHNYLEIEANDMSSIKKLDSILKKYYEAASATSLYYENHLDNSNARKFLFLIDNKWHRLTVDMSFTTSFYDNKYVKYHDNRLQYFEIVDDFYALPYGIYSASYKLDNTIPKISYYVDYFDKQEHVKELSNTMNNDRGAGWNGVAYIHYIYGKDTLKYKEDNVKLNDKTAWDSWTKYEQIPLIYTNTRLDFVIIDDFYVTPKQKTNRVNN